MAVKCKRIINGSTYNTETATEIDGNAVLRGGRLIGEYLYHNRFGAFFLYRIDGAPYDNAAQSIAPLTHDEAKNWLEKRPNGAVHIEALFGDAPEAGTGESKFTLRIPESLRDRLAVLAKGNNQSLNAWIVRCLERCSTPLIG